MVKSALDPAIAQILPFMPLRDPGTLTPQKARDDLRALAAARADTPLPQVASVENAIVPGVAGPIGVRFYRPSAAPSPTVVFFHGGGWVAGDLETHDRQARQLSTDTGSCVVSVHYRRPPEAMFPAAFDDCLAAVRHIHANIADYGGDPARLGVAGDSAGGNLAAAVAIACRDSGLKLAGQLLAYPVTDVAGNYASDKENARFPSRRDNAAGYFLTTEVMVWFANHYLPSAGHSWDWRVSPLRADSLKGLAPAVVCTAEFDPLRDEGDAYAHALKAAGVETVHHRGASLVHGYFGMGAVSDAAASEASRARADFAALLKR